MKEMSSSSNISQSGYSPSEAETPQSTPQARIQNFDQSLDHGELGFEQTLKNAHKEMHQKRIQSLRKELDYLKSTEWKFEYDKGFVHNQNQLNDDEKENFLADELLALELQSEKEEEILQAIPERELTNTVCFQRTGIITDCGDNYIMIDGLIYYDLTGCQLNFNINDIIVYLGYRNTNDTIIVVRILENQGPFWGDEEIKTEEKNFDIIEHVLIGQVASRHERYVYMAENDLKFCLDDVEGSFIPIRGDWLELKCSVQQDSKKMTDISTVQVLKVITFNYIRLKIKSAIITECSANDGVCDRQIYYNSSAIVNGLGPEVGSKVLLEAIESTQGAYNWRALKILVIDDGPRKKNIKELSNEETVSLTLEEEKGIKMNYPLCFDKINFQETGRITLDITNMSNQTYILNKWIMLSKKRDSQLHIKPFINHPMNLESGQTFKLTVTCVPKFLGNTKECLVILFKGFQLKRFINISITDNTISKNTSNDNYKCWNESEKMEAMRKVKNKTHLFVPGVKPIKSPAFVSIKIGLFPIPEKIWAVVLGDSDQMIYTNEFNKILHKIETHLPFLAQELNISNYTDRWHTLLYMEEVQANINMRVHDRSKTFLIRYDEYLAIEINGLSEKRPSLIKGDKVIVKDICNESASQYEGFIHILKGDLILVKFNPQFHESYSGYDVSVEFYFSRTIYRRSHHAINLALSNLGPDILFPSRPKVKFPQIPYESINRITWFNETLNKCQKNAVINIIKGECRPLPYVIFGPPGTGKTITVIETILQILTLFPESRILVATPSNSAANLVAERLIKYKGTFSGSIIRLIANHLVDSDTIPEIIRSYCATLDIAIENSRKAKYMIKNKMHLHCQKSYIGRHRVTIGTCYALGALKHLDLPQGHFTHVIVDEAGQATEPEIMLPLTFIDKNHGQIILAGDPMQLGPIVMSFYCSEYGMNESFLCRLLERTPYLKDYDSFVTGFDNRLVTKLNDNYRSLDEVIKLSNNMFYDGTLVAKINKDLQWTSKFINAANEIFDSDPNTGGIFVCGIKGQNLRSEESPSWYNPQEAAMLALTVCKLYKKNIIANEIGIITPYLAQVKYIRIVFESMGLDLPKIGTVEEFQGQERAIILISTVRSNESLLQEDVRHFLGFIKNPKRMNVALTRAQIAVLLFCNPHLLSLDPLWDKVIKYAVTSNKYMGCDLPYDYNA